MAGFTIAQLEAIETAIAGGTLKVRYADKEVTFHSLNELRELRAEMREELRANGMLDGAPHRGVPTVTSYCRD